MKKKLGIVGIVLAVLSFGLVGWRIGGEIGSANENAVLDVWKIVLFIVGLFAAFYLHIILHELGHLVGGLKGGYEFVSFCVAGICFGKENGKIKVSTERHKDIGGFCKMLPPKDVTKESFLLHIKGGLVASCILTAVSFIAFILMYFLDKRGYFFMLFACSFPVNAFIFFNNAQVSAPNNTPTDGMLVDMLKNNAPSGIAMMKVLTFQGYLTDGVSPRDIPESVISDIPVVPDDDVMTPVIYSNLFVYYLDKADEEKIFYYGKKIEDILPYFGDVYRNDLLSSALLVSCFEDNAEKAGKYYKELEKCFDKADSAMLLAKAYYEKLFLLKDVTELIEKIKEKAAGEPFKGVSQTTVKYANWLVKL